MYKRSFIRLKLTLSVFKDAAPRPAPRSLIQSQIQSPVQKPVSLVSPGAAGTDPGDDTSLLLL